MSKRILALMILVVSLLTINSELKSEIVDETIQYYTIDGFEVQGEWKVVFSHFRSKRWSVKEERENANREEDELWYQWFVADGETFTRKELLSGFIAKNQKLFPNQKTILGIRARFDRHGYNYISLEPKNLESGGAEKRYGPNNIGRLSDQIINNDELSDQHYVNYDGENYILLPGQTKEIALWVWGSMRNYTLEFHVEDYQGVTHVLKAGTLNFRGWKRMSVSVPEFIKQEYAESPKSRPLKLKRIRFVQDPKDKLEGTFIFVDYLHGKTNTDSEGYVGDGLEKSERVWKRNQTKKGAN